MSRIEFSRKLRAAIVFRATNDNGIICCEGCGLVLGKKPHEIDHIIPEALQDHTMKRNLTAEDGQLLGKDCCHKAKTKADVQAIAKVKRIRDKDTGAMKRKSRPMAGTKASGLKRKMNGSVERRD